MGLSHNWRVVLTKLAEYGDEGITRTEFVNLIGSEKHRGGNLADIVLDQMFFSRIDYYEPVPGDMKKIRITLIGKEALE